MADDRVCEIITKFFLGTCQSRRRMTEDDALVWRACAVVATTKYEDSDVEAYSVPLITGSVAEFTIEPMLPCIGDVDIMLHYSSVIAIPEGCSPPTQLPGEFDSRVEVCEIVDSQFPGYVYLHRTSMLAESVDDGMYNVVHCEPAWSTHHDDLRRHGPAVVGRLSTQSLALTQSHAGLGLVNGPITIAIRAGFEYDSTTIRVRYNILRGVMCFRAIMNMSILSRCCRML